MLNPSGVKHRAARQDVEVAVSNCGEERRCGALINMKPYYDLLEKDESIDPAEAWERVKPQIVSGVMYATWHRDFVAGGIGGGQGRFCSIGQIKCALPGQQT